MVCNSGFYFSKKKTKKQLSVSTEPSFSSSGTPINKRPVLGYRNLNLFKLYRLVHKLGGFDNVSVPPPPPP